MKIYKELNFTLRDFKKLISSKVIIEDLSSKEVSTLVYIVKNSSEDNEINVKNIQQFFEVKVSSIVPILNKLEQKNLIKRVSSKLDKRVSIIIPNNKAINLVDNYLLICEKLLNDCIDNIEEFEKALLTFKNFNNKLKVKDVEVLKMESR